MALTIHFLLLSMTWFGYTMEHTNPTVSPKQNLIDYTVSIILHHEFQAEGVFNCVFYDLFLSPHPYNNVLGEILRSPLLHRTTKFVLNNSFHMTMGNPPESLPVKPNLMVVYLGEQIFKVSLGAETNTLKTFDPNTRVLVIVNDHNDIYVLIMHLMLDFYGFNKVVYIGETRCRLLHPHDSGAVSVQHDLPHPRTLFQDALRNMQGRSIKATSLFPANLRFGVHIQWLKETARHLNATLDIRFNPCKKFTTSWDKCFMDFVMGGSIDIALSPLIMGNLHHFFNRALFQVIPKTMVVLVPEGRTLNVTEMYLQPFSWQVWIVLLLIVLSAEIFKVIIPRLKNDPILLALCGFERYSLHRVERHEQWILFTLIVLCFFVTNAYETKFIALMIEKPSVENAESFQDLVDQGIELELDVRGHNAIQRHPVLGPLIVHNPYMFAKLNASRGYLLERQLAEALMALSVNYNFDRKRANFHILRNTLGMRLSFYWMPFQSPLVELFQGAQRRFFEAGFLEKWIDFFSSALLSEIRNTERNVSFATNSVLKFADFVPLWMVYGMGLTVSGVVLFVEIVFKFYRWKRDKKKVMRINNKVRKKTKGKCISNFLFISSQKAE